MKANYLSPLLAMLAAISGEAAVSKISDQLYSESLYSGQNPVEAPKSFESSGRLSQNDQSRATSSLSETNAEAVDIDTQSILESMDDIDEAALKKKRKKSFRN